MSKPTCLGALLAAGFALAMAPSPACAQEASSLAAKIVVGFPPGGSADAVARLLADKLRTELARNVIVENRPGAGGRIAAAWFKTAPADGSVLLLANDLLTVSYPLVYASLPYEPSKDLKPVAQIVEFPFAFVSGAMVNVTNFSDYVKWAKRNPASAQFGTPAAGSPPHFFGLMVSKAIGVDLGHVPYQGGAQLVTNIMGGQISSGINALGDMIEMHRAGKVRILATSGDTRSAQVPDVPTFEELGYHGISGKGFFAVYAPRATPDATVERWNIALQNALKGVDLNARLLALGLQPRTGSAEALAELQRKERAAWAPVIEASGFKAQ